MEQGDYEGAKVVLHRALAIARREGDTALEMRSLANAVQVDTWNLRYLDALDSGLRIVELSGQVDEPFSEFLARYYSSHALRITGDLDGARSHAEACVALAQQLRDRWSLASAFYVSQNVAQAEGNWRMARECSERALAIYPTDSRALSGRIQLEYQLGDFSQGKAFMERLLEAMRLNVPAPNATSILPAATIPFVARITGVADWLDAAQEAQAVIRSSPSANPLATYTAEISQALLAVFQGDTAAASKQYAALGVRRYAIIPTILMAVDRLLALLAQTIGNLDQAVNHFEEALAFCRKAGFRPELAWTCCDYADTLLQCNKPGDREKAITLLDECLAISSELGMRPLMERAMSRQDGL
jgi:tetratricopeptide (TPR) repeat protein